MDKQIINGIILPLVSECYEDTRNANMFPQYMNLGKVRFNFSAFIDSTDNGNTASNSHVHIWKIMAQN